MRVIPNPDQNNMAIRTAPADYRRDPGIDKTPFGVLAGGERADLYTLRNANGVEAKVTNYGGIVVSLIHRRIASKS